MITKLRNSKKVILTGRKFLSVINSLQLNLFKRKLRGKDPNTNQGYTIPGTPSIFEHTILNEPFGLAGINSFGIPYYNIPTGWAKSHITVIGFDFSDAGSDIPQCNIVGSSATIGLVFSNANVRQEYLTTSAISTVGMVSIKLNFNEYRGTFIGNPPPLTLEYSINNGSTWTSITWTETVLGLTWVNTGDINLPANAQNITQLKIRFGVFGDAANEYVSLDDIKIKATY